jgi:hypothetical protein
MMPKGELLWSGCCEFPAATGTDGAMKFMDVPRLAIGSEETFLLSVRNGSEDEIINLNVGQMLAARPYPRDEVVRRQSCTAADVASTITTLKPHRLKVGDRIAFEGTGGGVTADLYYWVIPSILMTDFVFQISATFGGAAVNLNADAANVFTYVPSPNLVIPAAAGSVAGDTYTCATYHGLAKGDAVVSDVSADIIVAGTVYYVIDAGFTAKVFSLSAARGGLVLNVGATTAQNFRVVEEFYSHTTFTVPLFAAGTYLVPVAGMISKLIQGWPYGANGGRILVSPGDQTYDAFCVTAEIRRA